MTKNRCVGLLMVLTACGGGASKSTSGETTPAATASPTRLAAARQEVSTIQKRVAQLVGALPTGLQGRRAGVALPGIAPTGNGNLPDISGQWSLASSDVASALDPLENAGFDANRFKRAKAAASALGAGLEAIASCIAALDPDFYVQTVNSACATLFDQTVLRAKQFTTAMAEL